MREPLLKVVIVDNARAEKCEGSCGVNWSLPESISLVKERLRQKYREKVSLEYLDMAQPAACQQAQPLVKEFPSLAMPILFINGQPKIWGDFDLRMLLDMVEAELDVNYDQSL